MKIVIDDSYSNVIIDGAKRDIDKYLDLIYSLSESHNVDLSQCKISNPYLRAVIMKPGNKNIEYHILEFPAKQVIMKVSIGTSISKYTVEVPNTIMILKFTKAGGKFIKAGDRVFHTLEPLKQDLSNDVYHWELSNVYEAMNICWGAGGATIGNMDRDRSQAYLKEFMFSIRNNDLSHFVKWSSLSKTGLNKIKPTHRANCKVSDMISF